MIEPTRAPRADATRNRALLLDAARSLFAERGIDVSVDEIAKAAGVGHGTAFRHFRTKDDLLAAVLEQRMDAMLAVVRTCASLDDPWTAFETMCVEMVGSYIADHGYMDALKRDCVHGPGIDECKTEMMVIVVAIIERAHAAGVLRSDVGVADLPGILMAAAHGGSVSDADGGGPNAWRRILALLLDGMRVGGHPSTLPDRR